MWYVKNINTDEFVSEGFERLEDAEYELFQQISKNINSGHDFEIVFIKEKR